MQKLNIIIGLFFFLSAVKASSFDVEIVILILIWKILWRIGLLLCFNASFLARYLGI